MKRTFDHPFLNDHTVTIRYGSCGNPNQITITRGDNTNIIETLYDVETECIWSGKSLYVFTYIVSPLPIVRNVHIFDITHCLRDNSVSCISPVHSSNTLVCLYDSSISVFRGSDWGRVVPIPFGHWRAIASILPGIIILTCRVAWNEEINEYDEWQPLPDSDDRTLVYDHELNAWYTTNDEIDLSQYQIWTNTDYRLQRLNCDIEVSSDH